MKTESAISELPSIYMRLKGLRVPLPKGGTAIILMRTRQLSKKPPLYMFNLDTNTYVSSLKKAGDFFQFGIRDESGKDAELYQLNPKTLETKKLN